MKIFSLLSFILVFSTAEGISQWKFHLTGGFSPQTESGSAALIINRHLPLEEFTFLMSKVNPQFFIGLKGQVDLKGSFFADIGLMYSNRTSNYQIEYTMIHAEHSEAIQYLSQSKYLLIMPVNMGVNLGLFDVTSGFRLIHAIEGRSELNPMRGFSTSGKQFSLGWQWGGGFHISKSRIGLEYQGSFSRTGNDMTFQGQSLEFMDLPGQWVLTLQQSF
jgi:hypothetical protein